MTRPSASLILLAVLVGWSSPGSQAFQVGISNKQAKKTPPLSNHESSDKAQQPYNSLNVAPRYVADNFRYEPMKHSFERFSRTVQDQVMNVDNQRRAAAVVDHSSRALVGLAQGAAWLVTDDKSPAAPLKQAATQFLAQRLGQAHKHLLAHGESTRAAWLEAAAHWKQDFGGTLPLQLPEWKHSRSLDPTNNGLATLSESLLGKELLTKIYAASDTPVIDDEILQIQQMAQQLEKEVDAQIASSSLSVSLLPPAQNNDKWEYKQEQDLEFADRALLRVKNIMQVNAFRPPTDTYVPKPLLDSYKQKKRNLAKLPQANNEEQLNPAPQRTVLVHGLEKDSNNERGGRPPKRNKPNNNNNRNQKKDFFASPVPKRTDPEIFQRKLLTARLEMETKQRQLTHQKQQEQNQRSLLQTRFEGLTKERSNEATPEEGALHTKHLFLTELQNGNAEKGKKKPFPPSNPEEEPEKDVLIEGKEHQLFQLVNASLGLTAPVDLLKDDVEMKHREVEHVRLADEKYQQSKARVLQEQAELRNLMETVQRTSMEKMKRAKQAREEGTLPVIVAALGQENARREAAKLERPKKAEPSGAEFEANPKEKSFAQLNQQIREKYEQEKVRQAHAVKKQQPTYVVNKLERKQSRGVARAAIRFFKRSLKPIGVMAVALVHFYFSCVNGGSAAKTTTDGKILPHVVPGWKALLDSA